MLNKSITYRGQEAFLVHEDSCECYINLTFVIKESFGATVVIFQHIFLPSNQYGELKIKEMTLTHTMLKRITEFSGGQTC